ncbi:MAG: hypothetical protein CMJ59_21075 [Planctomycetaceae bacterium]|nr:hypothetical protein [Planctomycetaceae bacterium]
MQTRWVCAGLVLALPWSVDIGSHEFDRRPIAPAGPFQPPTVTIRNVEKRIGARPIGNSHLLGVPLQFGVRYLMRNLSVRVSLASHNATRFAPAWLARRML